MSDSVFLTEEEKARERELILGSLEELLRVPIEERDIGWMRDVQHESKHANLMAAYSLSSESFYREQAIPLFLRASEEMDRFDDYLMENNPKYYETVKEEIIRYLHQMERRIITSSILNKAVA